MRNNRKNAGFTMGELLTVVAILVVLMGLIFVGVIQYQRSMKQLELDGIAREIFVAAQNHLTMADSQGMLDHLDDTQVGTKVSGTDDEYYFVAGSGKTAPKVWELMLPFGAVDETVRLGGNYVIHYQKDGARVLDVFYAEPGTGRFKHTFSDSEYESSLKGLTGEDQRKERRTYGDDKAVIGWFGGDGLVEGKKLERPSIQVINAERLLVNVTDPNAGRTDYNLYLVVEGVSSGKQKAFSLVGQGAVPDYNVGTGSFCVDLDDITTQGKHFADQFEGFTPGEDLIIYAKADSTTVLVRPVQSTSKQTNSLFGSMEKVSDHAGNVTETANITNIRHLENLGTNVSTYTKDGGVNAAQSRDLSWKEFCTKIAQAKGMDARNVQVYDRNTGPTEEGTYLPANPDKPLNYNGQGYKIQDVMIDQKADDQPAGIFGKLTGSTVENVLVCNDNTKDDTDLTIAGSGSTGGLVGEMIGGTLEQCAAAVYVSSAEGDAGGLVGTADDVTIINCYSGGHTQDGAYLAETTGKGHWNVQAAAKAGGLVGDASNTVITSSYSTCSATGGQACGGLIGAVDGTRTTVGNCYATGLVAGAENNTGAFVGSGIPNLPDDPEEKNYYYSIINGDLPALGSNADSTAISALDENLSTYNSFVTLQRNAQPYDSFLRESYGGKYGLRTIDQLTYDTPPRLDWISTHYGDWPAPETLVVNEK